MTQKNKKQDPEIPKVAADPVKAEQPTGDLALAAPEGFQSQAGFSEVRLMALRFRGFKGLGFWWF